MTRRRLMDWGAFYVEKAPASLFMAFRRILAQRNAILRNKVNYSLVRPWDEQFVRLSNKIDEYRKAYLKKFLPRFITYQRHFGIPFELNLIYHRGWNEKKDLQEVLIDTYERDVSCQHSMAGPHKAELHFKRNGIPVAGVISRGQLKTANISAVFAQLDTCSSDERPIILIDDLASELDQNMRARVWETLDNCNAQCVATDLGEAERKFPTNKGKLFHVKQGLVF